MSVCRCVATLYARSVKCNLYTHPHAHRVRRVACRVQYSAVAVACTVGIEFLRTHHMVCHTMDASTGQQERESRSGWILDRLTPHVHHSTIDHTRYRCRLATGLASPRPRPSASRPRPSQRTRHSPHASSLRVDGELGIPKLQPVQVGCISGTYI